MEIVDGRDGVFTLLATREPSRRGGYFIYALNRASLEGVFDTTADCHMLVRVQKSETGLGDQLRSFPQVAQSDTGCRLGCCFWDEHVLD
jgi:hypothetical protein